MGSCHVPRVLPVMLLAAAASAQPVSLSGRVVDEQAQPIQGASVELLGQAMATQTDAAGRFSFSVATRAPSRGRHTSAPFVVRGDRAWLTVEPGVHRVDVEVLDLAGRMVARTRHDVAGPGQTALTLGATGNLGEGAYLVRVRAGERCWVLRRTVCGPGRGVTLALLDQDAAGQAKALAVVDSLHCWKSGYENEVVTVDSLIGALPSDVVLRRGVAFEPYARGSGRVPLLATADSASLPMAAMIHVIVFPEGYLQSDLDAGEYEQDLASWYQQVFALDIVSYLKDAFVIWKCALPSNEHLVTTGTVDSYFRLPLSNGAMASTGYDTAAARTWRLLARFPFPARSYPASLNARSIVCSYMLYDTRYQRAGFSGMATSFTNPVNTAQRVNVAMALDQHHEFMHAMARLGDEYYDTTYGPLSDNTLRLESRYVTNVVSRNTCDTLPWKHLLHGGQYNPSVDSLVGAFGVNGRYHPEFKCLMNGSHHNSVLYGGSNNLRTSTRLCNWCRELTAFRIYERSSVLPDQATSYQTWVASWRAPFYAALHFYTPAVVPQENSLGTPWFVPCQ